MSVVVGVDGSAGSVRALKWAAEEAKARKTVLKVVFAWSFLDQPQGTFDPNYGEEQARAKLEEILASHAADLDGVDVERLVVNDLPASALLDQAKGADALVVGSRGLGGFRGLLLGSVSQQVANHAPCAVVIVPGEERGK